jgi:hypothetical protein
MITYAQSQGKVPFDWWAFLYKSDYSQDDLVTALQLSGSWITCACGSQCESIARDEIGMPEDDELADLGSAFCGHIGEMLSIKKKRYPNTNALKAFNNHRLAAINCLSKIEDRVSELLLEMDSK